MHSSPCSVQVTLHLTSSAPVDQRAARRTGLSGWIIVIDLEWTNVSDWVACGGVLSYCPRAYWAGIGCVHGIPSLFKAEV